VTVLPDPPPSLPPEPRAFYETLRAELAGTILVAEVDFGDAGVGVSFPHVDDPGATVGAQVSRRAAVVFAGAAAEHFDERSPGWTDAAAAAVVRGLAGFS
jgi:hypothetical protein